jgi:hypothetical protein
MRALSLALLLGVVLPACSVGVNVGAAQLDNPNEPVMPVDMNHEACDPQAPGAIHIDTDHDGKPDAVQILRDGKEVCRAVDSDHDGKFDTFLYLDASGQLRRQETDHNQDGQIEEVRHFEGGVLVRKDQDTGADGKADTWEMYEKGEVVKRYYDRDHNGQIDQWWWLHAKNKNCGTMHTDKNGDGKADTKEEHCAPPSAPPPAPPAH